ncbi:acyltransferase family protein [Calycomorphotria hydatis]|uniref:O-acetyltransferase OatA n=1 Tax=Calycomorphotria hydatis TaxID=2528027 RepID=A0A517TEE1_9PLAN|nr:O-acetyltransferase OatA [Calycomorphotria hydatis]
MKNTPLREYIPELDGLRAFACLLVLWEHTGIRGLESPTILHAGSTGVDLFFVLPGFLITRILLFNRSNHIPLSSFILRRTARIFPVAFAGILMSLAIRPSPSLIFPATYVQNYAAILGPGRDVICGHYWTLSIEEQFYLIFPMVVLNLKPKHSQCIVLLLILFCFFTIAALYSYKSDLHALTYNLALTNGTTTRGWLLLAGALISYHESILRLQNKPATICLLACISLCALTYWIANVKPSASDVTSMLSRQLIVLGLFCFCLSPIISQNFSVLKNEKLRFIGNRSYGLYVYHMMIFDVCGIRKHSEAANSSDVVNALLAYCLTIFTAEVSYRYMEQPISRFVRASTSNLIRKT